MVRWRGENTGPDSDVDLLVVTRDRVRVRKTLWHILGDVAFDSGPVVSPLVATPQEFDAIPWKADVLRGGAMLLA